MMLALAIASACSKEMPTAGTADGGGAGGAGGTSAEIGAGCGQTAQGGAVGLIERQGEDSAFSLPNDRVIAGSWTALSGTTLQVLGQERGLQLVDVSVPEQPAWQARVPLVGQPLELYARGSTTLLVTRPLPYSGPGQKSRLMLIDVANPAAPQLRDQREMDARIVATRIIDGRLVVVSNGAPNRGTGDLAVETFSFDDPERLAPLGRATFGGFGHAAQVLIAGTRLVIANQSGSVESNTQVTVVDLDASSLPKVRGATSFAGVVARATHMGLDEAAGVLTLVAHSQSTPGDGITTLRTFSVTAAGDLAPLGTLALPEVPADVAIAGTRAVLAGTALTVVDLATPQTPVPGVPVSFGGKAHAVRLDGDRLLLLSGATAADGSQTPLSVSSYQLHGAAPPQASSRIDFSLPGYNGFALPRYGTLGARLDGPVFFAPAGQPLVIPFASVSDGGNRSESALELIDLDPVSGRLSSRGRVPGHGDLRGIFGRPDGRLLAAGSHVWTIDPRAPVLTETRPVDLERFIMDIAVDGQYGVELVGDPDHQQDQLHLVPATDPEIAVPLAIQLANTSSGEVLARAGRAYVVSDQPGQPDPGATRIVLHDIAPGLPRRGTVTLPFRLSGLTWGARDEGINVALVGATTLAVRPTHELLSCPPEICIGGQVFLVDAALPDAPTISAKIQIPGAQWAAVVVVSDQKLLVAHHARPNTFGADLGPTGNFFVTEVDATDPRQPVLSPPMAVPGLLLGAHGDRLYTASFAHPAACGPARTTTFHVSRREAGGQVHLLGSVAVPEVDYNSSLVVEGEALFVVAAGSLVTLDLRGPAGPTIAARLPGVSAMIEAAGPGLVLSRTAAFRYDAGLVPHLDREIDAPWARTVRVYREAGRGFVPRGKKGVEVFSLGAASP